MVSDPEHRCITMEACKRVHNAYRPEIAKRDAQITALRASLATARADALEEAAKACEQQERDFLSPEYATQQPLSSFQERFACRQCAAALRALAKEKGDG